MLDPLSLFFAAVLAFGASTDSGGTDDTRAVIIDTGSPTQQAPPPAPDEARSQIIDTGNQ